MRVVWSTEERFVKPTLVSILSLLEHASGGGSPSMSWATG